MNLVSSLPMTMVCPLTMTALMYSSAPPKSVLATSIVSVRLLRSSWRGTAEKDTSHAGAEPSVDEQIKLTFRSVIEYFPGTQSSQRVVDTSAANFPASQMVHAEEAADGEKVPAGQSAHVLMLEAATAAEDVPAAQRVQSAMPASCAYVPGEHRAQVATLAAPRAGDALPAAHWVQTEAPDAGS